METNEVKEPVQENTGKKKKKKVKKPMWREILEWVFTLLAAIVVGLSIRTFLFEPVMVDGSSMFSTLKDRDIMICTKPEYASTYLFGKRYTFFGDPNRFDVVICHYPGRMQKNIFGMEEPTNFVKRIVGIPGDVIEMKQDEETGLVYLWVNGEKYEENYLLNRANYITREPITVPEGQYFVLGDNRSNSNDSHIIGPIDRDMIVGHVQCVVFPNTRMIPNGLKAPAAKAE